MSACESKRAWPLAVSDGRRQPIRASLAPTETSTRGGAGWEWGKGEREKQGTRGEVTVGGGVDGQRRKPINGQPGKAVQPICDQLSNGLPNRKSQQADRDADAGEGKR